MNSRSKNVFLSLVLIVASIFSFGIMNFWQTTSARADTARVLEIINSKNQRFNVNPSQYMVIRNQIFLTIDFLMKLLPYEVRSNDALQWSDNQNTVTVVAADSLKESTYQFSFSKNRPQYFDIGSEQIKFKVHPVLRNNLYFFPVREVIQAYQDDFHIRVDYGMESIFVTKNKLPSPYPPGVSEDYMNDVKDLLLQFYVNGEKMNWIYNGYQIVASNSHLYLAYNVLCDYMNVSCSYDEQKQVFISQKDGITVQMKHNNKEAYVNGVKTEIPYPEYRDAWKVFEVPVRFFLKTYGGTVHIDKKAKRVDITLLGGNFDVSNKNFTVFLNRQKVVNTDVILPKSGELMISYDSLNQLLGLNGFVYRGIYHLQQDSLNWELRQGLKYGTMNRQQVNLRQSPGFGQGRAFYVNLRPIAESLGYSLQFEGKTGTIRLDKRR